MMENSTSTSMNSISPSILTPFDPYQQNFTIYTSQGTPVNVSIPQLDEFVLYGIQISINYGVQIGASTVLFILLLLLTKADKRTSPIFLVNSLSLLLNIIRNVLLCLFFTSAFNESYNYFTGDYSLVPQSDYASSITATVFEMLTLISIETSLCLQVQVVCATLRRMYRLTIFALSTAIALMAVSLRLIYTVKNDILILQTLPLDSLYSLGSATNIATSVSICWFSAVFVIKLGFALRTRRKLGLGRFSSMHIIFIMGCQTLGIPALFSILQYFVDNPAMSSEVITAVVIFLPLSSLWAAASVESRTQNFKEKSSQHRLFGSNSSGSAGTPALKRHPSSPIITTGRTSESTSSTPRALDEQGLFKDVEAQNLVHSK